jgi:hypothetical protein
MKNNLVHIIQLFVCATSEWCYRYTDPISNGLMMAAAHCYCDQAHLSVTQLSNKRGDVIRRLLHVPEVN